MALFPSSLFSYILASIILLGAFSRFTKGRFTPWFHDYQQYHHPDDGTSTATMIPIIDSLVGSMILLQRTRFLAVLVADAFMIVGMLMQINAAKHFEVDVVMVSIATLAALGW